MTFSNKNFYFETSAVNYLANKYDWKDALATKGLQNAKGNLWYISPVTLWEILLTTNPEQRERLIFYCQHLFHENLLNSPSEFIVKYLEKGCPEVEKRYNFHSKLHINQSWNNICLDKRQTLKFDIESLKERMSIFHAFSKQLNSIINRIVLDITINDRELEIQQFVNKSSIYIQDCFDQNDSISLKIAKISILLAFYILCLELDLDNTPQKNYWHKIGINESVDRLIYLLKKHPELFFRGPISQMATMAYHQIKLNKTGNRGLFMDCLHSIYITYADIFITNDPHFTTLKESKIHPNCERLFEISKTGFTTVTKSVFNPHL